MADDFRAPVPNGGAAESAKTAALHGAFRSVTAAAGFMVLDLATSKKTDPSLPDYLVLRADHLRPISVKLLGDKGEVSKHQQDRFDYLHRCGDIDTEVYRPVDTEAMCRRFLDA